eukprot:7417742-Karenia_brevis.AAC.1
MTLSNPTWLPPKRLHAAMCNRQQFWEAFKLNPPLFPNSRVVEGVIRFGTDLMFNAQRFDLMPDGWTIDGRIGTQ